MAKADSTLCKTTLFQERHSPDMRCRVVVFEVDCGATTAFNTRVSVISAREASLRTGNVLVGIESQLDCTLFFGRVEYLRTLDVSQQAGWPPRRCIPHGRHQMSLDIATGLGLGGDESYPDLFQPSGRFLDNVRVENSCIVMPELPGI